jgi:hypothetical protein
VSNVHVNPLNVYIQHVHTYIKELSEFSDESRHGLIKGSFVSEIEELLLLKERTNAGIEFCLLQPYSGDELAVLLR